MVSVQPHQRLALLLLPMLLLFTACRIGSAGTGAGGDLQKRKLNHCGVERTYAVHYPNNLKPPGPRPMVIVLHGAGGANAAVMARRTGLSDLGDLEGFLVVYPDGLKGHWNDGRGQYFMRGKGISQIDDVGFIAALIDSSIYSGEADPHRIYVTGASNGGMMAYRLGIELGDKLAAIAAIVANLPADLADRVPVRPLPVLIMNGTEDPIIPWKGGELKALGISYGTVLSTEETVKYWVAADHSPTRADTQMVADNDPNDQCRVEMSSFGAPGRGVDVVLYTIIGGGHNLPGGNMRDRPRMLGRKCMDINGAEVIWSFFKQHSLPAAQDSNNP